MLRCLIPLLALCLCCSAQPHPQEPPNFGGSSKPGTPVELGTIGAAFFEKRILLLDFVAQRLAILDKGEGLPAAIAERADFVPIDYRNHKIFISLTLNGVEESGLFFDTGSSSMAVTTTRARWLEWTGRQPDDAKNKVLAKSWGKDARWLGAPIEGSMCIGKAGVTEAVAFFEATGLENLDFDRYRSRPRVSSGISLSTAALP